MAIAQNQALAVVDTYLCLLPCCLRYRRRKCRELAFGLRPSDDPVSIQIRVASTAPQLRSALPCSCHKATGQIERQQQSRLIILERCAGGRALRRIEGVVVAFRLTWLYDYPLSFRRRDHSGNDVRNRRYSTVFLLFSRLGSETHNVLRISPHFTIVKKVRRIRTC